MRKLGKKNHEMKETIEAYRCGCSGYAVCSNCDNGYAHSTIDSEAYGAVRSYIS